MNYQPSDVSNPPRQREGAGGDAGGSGESNEAKKRAGRAGTIENSRGLVYLYENTSGFGMNSFTAGQLVTDVSSLIIGLL